MTARPVGGDTREALREEIDAECWCPDARPSEFRDVTPGCPRHDPAGPTDAQAQLREEIAVALYEHDRVPLGAPPWDDDLFSDELLGLRTAYRESADAILALSTVRDALAAQETLADIAHLLWMAEKGGEETVSARQLRRSLYGTTS